MIATVCCILIFTVIPTTLPFTTCALNSNFAVSQSMYLLNQLNALWYLDFAFTNAVSSLSYRRRDSTEVATEVERRCWRVADFYGTESQLSGLMVGTWGNLAKTDLFSWSSPSALSCINYSSLSYLSIICHKKVTFPFTSLHTGAYHAPLSFLLPVVMWLHCPLEIKDDSCNISCYACRWWQGKRGANQL